jgi:hypothetical protein
MNQTLERCDIASIAVSNQEILIAGVAESVRRWLHRAIHGRCHLIKSLRLLE